MLNQKTSSFYYKKIDFKIDQHECAPPCITSSLHQSLTYYEDTTYASDSTRYVRERAHTIVRMKNDKQKREKLSKERREVQLRNHDPHRKAVF